MVSRIMKLKKIAIPVMTLIIMASQLVGCAVVESSEMVKMIDAGESIVLEVASPSYNVVVQGEQKEDIEWIELDQLKTYNDGFRQGFDEVFNINIVTEKGANGKSGCLFVDETGDRNGNTTLEDALRNKVFVTKYWEDNKVRSKMAELANEVYQDIGDNETYGITASINAYYNLMPDHMNPSSFNPTQSLTREEFYTLVFKTEEGVQDLQPDSEFNNAIGNGTDNSIFAQQVAEYGFLKVGNKSLDENSYNGSISRAEAVYLLVNKHFPDQLKKVTGKEKAFSDTKNAGDVALKVGFKQKDKESKGIIEKDRWESYTLAFMLQNPDKGMQEELYKAMVVAKDLEIINSGDSRWDEPLSKNEAFQLIINTHLAKNKIYGYLSEVEYGNINVDKFYKGGIAGVDLTEVLGEDEDGDKFGENWIEVNPYQKEYHLDDEVGDGLTVRDLKLMVDLNKQQLDKEGYTEDDKRILLELLVEDYEIPLDVLLDMPPIENTVVEPAEKPAEKPAQKPSKPKQEQPKSDGYTRKLGVPGTFPKESWDKDGDGIDDAIQEGAVTEPVDATYDPDFDYRLGD